MADLSAFWSLSGDLFRLHKMTPHQRSMCFYKSWTKAPNLFSVCTISRLWTKLNTLLQIGEYFLPTMDPITLWAIKKPSKSVFCQNCFSSAIHKVYYIVYGLSGYRRKRPHNQSLINNLLKFSCFIDEQFGSVWKSTRYVLLLRTDTS